MAWLEELAAEYAWRHYGIAPPEPEPDNPRPTPLDGGPRKSLPLPPESMNSWMGRFVRTGGFPDDEQRGY
jgi:hypothetical protein